MKTNHVPVEVIGAGRSELRADRSELRAGRSKPRADRSDWKNNDPVLALIASDLSVKAFR